MASDTKKLMSANNYVNIIQIINQLTNNKLNSLNQQNQGKEMQESIQLDQSDNQQESNHNQFQFSSVISPKGRRLTKGLNTNTASQQSLAYSNSTYQKNQFTERSPPMFSMDNFVNNQNVNTMNFRPFDRKESTFGSGKGLAIQFDKIKEESYSSNMDDENQRLDETLSREKIDFPCFLSNQNSPNSKFNFNYPLNNDSLNNHDQDLSEISQRKPPSQSSKKYKKITPSSRKQIKQTIVKTIKDKLDNKQKDTIEKIQKNDPKPTRSTKLTTKSSKQSHERSTHSLISNEQKRSLSPLQIINKSSSSKYNQYQTGEDISALKQKIKELQYSLQVESISTEELRTKVSVLNELLQEKFLEKNGINFKLFKNSSPSALMNKSNKNNQQKNHFNQKDYKSYSNIDLYVEMKVLEKAKQQIQIQYERLRNQMAENNALLKDYAKKCQQLNNQLIASQKSKNQIKTQTSFNSKTQHQQRLSSKDYQQNDHLHQRMNQLEQQNQNLLFQIQSQKNLLKQKDQKVTQLINKLKQGEKRLTETQSYVKLFEQKEKRFTQIQRPKFIMQIKDITQKLDHQREQIDRLQMENNLIQIQLQQGFFKDSNLQMTSSPQGKLSILHKSKIINQQFGSPQLSSQRYHLSQPKSQLSQPRSQGPSLINQVSPKHLQTNQGKQDYFQNGGIPDAMTLIMHQQEQLKLLKTERDYFREQNEQFKQIQKDNCKYRLQIEDLKNEIHSLRQIINLDDSCTF